jgi:hypothetical protein
MLTSERIHDAGFRRITVFFPLATGKALEL